MESSKYSECIVGRSIDSFVMVAAGVRVDSMARYLLFGGCKAVVRDLFQPSTDTGANFGYDISMVSASVCLVQPVFLISQLIRCDIDGGKQPGRCFGSLARWCMMCEDLQGHPIQSNIHLFAMMSRFNTVIAAIIQICSSLVCSHQSCQ